MSCNTVLAAPELPSWYYGCGGACTDNFCLDALGAPSLVMPAQGQQIVVGPVFFGTARANATVNIRMDEEINVVTRADANGNFALQWTAPLAPGEHTACVSQALGQCVSPATCVDFVVVPPAPEV